MSRVFLVVAGGLGLTAGSISRAAQIDWGNALSAGDVNFTSWGDPLDVGFTFALGTFGGSFVPEAGNSVLWEANWKEIDTADYNPLYDYFTAETPLADNSVFAAGEDAYIWIYNTRTAGAGSEWLLMRGGTWEVPVVSGSQTELPLQWRASGVDQLVFGGKDNLQGPGAFTVTPVHFSLQTHGAGSIPEPAAGVLGVIAGVLALRRRRSLAPAGPPAAVACRLVATGLAVVGPCASAAPFTYEVTPSATIPDNDAIGVSVAVTVPDHFVINDLNVGVNVGHPRRGDLGLRLTSPAGTTVTLLVTSADADDSFDLRLDSASVLPVDDNDADDAAAPYYERTAGPDDPLDAFNGEDPAGTWTVTAIDLAAGEAGTLNRLELAFDLEIVIPPAVAVGNLVFLDVDGDGRHDPGDDPSLDGVRVRLFTGGDVEVEVGPDGIRGTADDAPGGMLTHDGGCYLFSNLEEDSYYVSIPASEFAPGGPLFGLASSPPDAAGDVIDDDADENGLNLPAPELNGIRTALFALAEDSEPVDEPGKPASQSDDDNTNLTIDFGFVRTARVGNRVWIDEDGDGRQDAGERGLADVTVVLCDSAGNVLSTAATDAQGGYGFEVVPGTYRIKVDEITAPAGFTQTSLSPELGSDLVNQNQNAGLGYEVVLGPAGENLTADFGYNINPTVDVDGGVNFAALGDRVWIDSDGDGRQGPAELGIPNVTVRLVAVGPDELHGTVDDEVLVATSTDALGYYLFAGLPAGVFGVNVDATTLPAGHVQTGDPDSFAAVGGVNDHATTVAVLLAPGDVFLNADFGYRPPPAADNAVAGTVWLDADADGGKAGAESGIARVTVALILDVDGDAAWDEGEPIVATDETDVDGRYRFSGLPDGIYLVWLNDTGNVLAGLRQTYDGDGVATAGISAAHLDEMGLSGSPVADLSQGFGFTPAPHGQGEGLIGDLVWLDLSLDGVFDPDEFPLEGVVVRLVAPGPDTVFGTTDDILAAVTRTDENGRYALGGLAPGTWRVETTPFAGLIPTADADGVGSPNRSTVTLGPGEPPHLNQDFGYQSAASGTIGNLVFLDSDANGVNDPDGADDSLGTDDDEPGLAGITLDLYLDHDGDHRLGPGDTLFSDTVTNALGEFLFTGLPIDHHYLVDVTDRAGLVAGHWHSRSDAEGVDASRLDPSGIELTAAAPDVASLDFGYHVESSSIGNHVWFDPFGIGSQPASNTGLPGVVVTLAIDYPDGTITVVRSETDGDGFYSFGNLLLDEDHRSGGAGDPAATGLPRFTLSVAAGQESLEGLRPALIDRPGVDDTLDSDDPAGVLAVPLEGMTDVQPQLPASGESAIASYDFGYRTLQPLLYEAFVAEHGLEGADAEPVPDENGVGGNPDGDTFSNLFEYVVSSPPTSGVNPPCRAGIEVHPFTGQISLRVHRVAGQYDVTMVLEAAGSLGSPTAWQEPGLAPLAAPNGDGTETASFPDLEALGPAFADGDGFVRLRIDLYPPEEPDPIATTHSPVFGWTRRAHPGQGGALDSQTTTFSMPFLKCEVVSALVVDNSGSALDLAPSIGAASVVEALDPGERHFVEVVDGPWAGHRFEIDRGASTATSVAIAAGHPNNTRALTPGLLAGAGVVVRGHWKLGELFPPSGFLAGSEPTDSDVVLAHDAAGWATFWLADLGSGIRRWVSGGDAALADQGGRTLGPADGVFIQRRAPSIELVRAGTVRENSFACPLRDGCTLVGSGYPVDQSFDTRGMGLATGFIGSDDSPGADRVLFWLGDTVPGSAAYATDFLLDAGPPNQFWTSADDSSAANLDAELVFDATSAAFHCLQNGLPTFVIPAPWTP